MLTTNQINELAVGKESGFEYIRDQENNIIAFGSDSAESCVYPQHFKNYPYKITYHFNELGFRERPINEYQYTPIICIGDSFTVCKGLAHQHMFSTLLENKLGKQVLNFGLNGASNEWIARKLEIILRYFDPEFIFVKYSYLHRRENPDGSLCDAERTMHHSTDRSVNSSDDQNNWQSCHRRIKELIGQTAAAYSIVPRSGIWHYGELFSTDVTDLARDGYHYGINTSASLANTLYQKITDGR